MDKERMVLEDAIQSFIESERKNVILERCVCALAFLNTALVIAFAIALFM